MKFKELNTLKLAELDKKEAELRLELIKQQAQVATGTTPKSPGQIKQLKKTLARIEQLRTHKNPVEEQ